MQSANLSPSKDPTKPVGHVPHMALPIRGTPRTKSFSEESPLLHPEIGTPSEPGRIKRVSSVSSIVERYSADAYLLLQLLSEEERQQQQLLTESRKTSTTQTAITFVKSMVGTFILYLPHLFALSGIVAGSVFLSLIAFFATVNMVLLSDCHDLLPGYSFGHLAEATYGRIGRISVDISIVLSQLGFCCTYFVYIARTVAAVAPSSVLHHHHHKSDDDGMPSSALFVIGFLTLLFIPLSWIRRIKAFGFMMLAANICVFAGLLITAVYTWVYLSEHGVAEVELFDRHGVLLFLGSSVICFEGIGLLIPIKESMQKPQEFKPLVVSIMAILALVFIAFAVTSYMAFGDEVETFITLNLPENGVGVFVQVVYCLAIVLAYPLQLFPAVEIMERVCFIQEQPVVLRRWKKNVFRTAVVCFTAIVAIATGKSFDNFVALVGALCAVPLALIYPPLIHLRLQWNEINQMQRIGEAVIVLCGIVSMFICTTQALATWK